MARRAEMSELTPQHVLADLFGSGDFPPEILLAPAHTADVVINQLLDADFEIKPADIERGSTARAMRPSAEETQPCHLTQLLRQ
jgi:hypothetical protein